VTDHALSFMHDHAAIAAEAALDAFCVLRSSALQCASRPLVFRMHEVALTASGV
jgi:hypothetical protein